MVQRCSVPGLEAEAGDGADQGEAEGEEKRPGGDHPGGGDTICQPAPHRVQQGVAAPVQHEHQAHLHSTVQLNGKLAILNIQYKQ